MGPKISNFLSMADEVDIRNGFEIENSIAVMSPLNGHNKGPYKQSF